MLIFIIVLAGTFTSNVMAAPLGNPEVRCFTSINGPKKINLKFSTVYLADDQMRVGYVRYEKSSEPILLLFSGEQERTLSSDRPYEVTTAWREIFSHGYGGVYTVLSQGAMVYKFTYTNLSNKVTEFEYNSNATSPDYSACEW